MKKSFYFLYALILLLSGCASAKSGFSINSSVGLEKDSKPINVSFEETQFTTIKDQETGIVIETETTMYPGAVLETEKGSVILVLLESKAQEFLGASDILLIKLNAEGDIIWKKRHVSPINNTRYSVNDALITSDGNIVICGAVGISGAYVPVVMKFNMEGELLWRKTSDEGSFSSMIEDDEGNYILLKVDNNIINFVKIAGNDIFEGNLIDFSISKIDPEYNRRLGSAVFCKLPDNSGYMLTGEFSAKDYTSDLFMAYFNNDFKLNWTKTFDYKKWEKYPGIQVLDDSIVSTVLLRSSTSSSDTALVQSISQDGNILWQKKYSDMNMHQVNSAGSNLIIGTNFQKNSKDSDILVFSSDIDDNIKWITYLGTEKKDIFRFIKTLKDGSTIVVGCQSLSPESKWNTVVVYRLDTTTGKILW